jgi:hypothetical protein
MQANEFADAHGGIGHLAELMELLIPVLQQARLAQQPLPCL